MLFVGDYKVLACSFVFYFDALCIFPVQTRYTPFCYVFLVTSLFGDQKKRKKTKDANFDFNYWF